MPQPGRKLRWWDAARGGRNNYMIITHLVELFEDACFKRHCLWSTFLNVNGAGNRLGQRGARGDTRKYCGDRFGKQSFGKRCYKYASITPSAEMKKEVILNHGSPPTLRPSSCSSIDVRAALIWSGLMSNRITLKPARANSIDQHRPMIPLPNMQTLPLTTAIVCYSEEVGYSETHGAGEE